MVVKQPDTAAYNWRKKKKKKKKINNMPVFGGPNYEYHENLTLPTYLSSKGINTIVSISGISSLLQLNYLHGFSIMRKSQWTGLPVTTSESSVYVCM